MRIGRSINKSQNDCPSCHLFNYTYHYRFFSNTSQDIFIPWSQFARAQILQLTFSILLCFYLPGYVTVNILENKIHKVSPVPKVLLAYIFSTAIVGGYLPGLFGIPISEILLVKSTYKNIRYQKLIQKLSLNQKFTN
jgi:hypothetical protein